MAPAPAFEPLDSFADIRQHAGRALLQAGVADVLPVPLEQVAEFLKLKQEDFLGVEPDAPPALRSLLAGLRNKTLGALHIPKRTIFINPDQPYARKRFTLAHEIGHDALPWHQAAYFGDDENTISPSTRKLLEREANAFAGEILFRAGRFNTEADSLAPGLAVPAALASTYGASFAATLRQYAERSGRSLALIATGRLPNASKDGPTLPVFPDQCVESDSFRARFGSLRGFLPDSFPLEGSTIGEAVRGLGTMDGPTTKLTLDTTNRGRVQFVAQVGTNQYLNFVLLSRRGLLSGQTLKLMS